MAISKKSYACLLVALALLAAKSSLAQQATSLPRTAAQPQTMTSEILLQATESQVFNVYGANGAAPMLTGDSATLLGSDRTNVYSDIVSYSTVEANRNLVLEASMAANIQSLSTTG